MNWKHILVKKHLWKSVTWPQFLLLMLTHLQFAQSSNQNSGKQNRFTNCKLNIRLSSQLFHKTVITGVPCLSSPAVAPTLVKHSRTPSFINNHKMNEFTFNIKKKRFFYHGMKPKSTYQHIHGKELMQSIKYTNVSTFTCKPTNT